MITVGLFCDHAGYPLKEDLKSLEFDDVMLKDYGTNSLESVDYPLFSKKAAHAFDLKEIDYAFLFCGTGIGICMAANRFPIIRAFVAHTVDEVEKARSHNNANTICFSGRYQSKEDTIPLINSFLKTSFEGGRHQKRVDMFS